MTIVRLNLIHLGLGILAIGTIGLLGEKSEPRPTSPPIPSGSAELAASDVRTSVYENETLTARVSAKRVSIEQARLLGPFRIGFLRALRASDVVVETYLGRDATQRSSQGIGAAVQSLIPRAQRTRVTQAEIDSLTWVEHRGDKPAMVRHAERCRVTRAKAGLTCRHRSGTDQSWLQEDAVQ